MNYGNDVRNGWDVTDGSNEGGRDEGTEFQISDGEEKEHLRFTFLEESFG